MKDDDRHTPTPPTPPMPSTSLAPPARASTTADALDRAISLYALSQVPHIGAAGLRAILRAFPDLAMVPEASHDVLVERLGAVAAETLSTGLRAMWPAALRAARDLMERQAAQGIQALVLGDVAYPPLLSLVPDAPVLLYAKGNLQALTATDVVAVVGTRAPTPTGRQIAWRVAGHFAGAGYAVVAGLARGIDFASHSGALAASGVTIAVMATALDQVYPTEHSRLAHQICAAGGVLVSEYAVSTRTTRSAFVQRDRLQAALALAVIPVQTALDGGTMHTVAAAERYGRMLWCPQPYASEAQQRQYEGIWALLCAGRAQAFQRDDYPRVLAALAAHKQTLLGSA